MDPLELASEPAPGYARRGEIQASLRHALDVLIDERENIDCPLNLM